MPLIASSRRVDRGLLRAGTRSHPALPEGGLPLRSSPGLFGGHPLGRRRQAVIDEQDVLIRPVLPGDLAAIDGLVRALSFESRVRRFHAPVRRLTSAQLAGLVDVDHHERETLTAWTTGRAPRLIAIAQWVALDAEEVEAAITVLDAWQGRSLGTTLARELVAGARDEGYRRMRCHVLADNQPMLRILTRLGTVLGTHSVRDGDALDVTIDLRVAGDATAPGGRAPQREVASAAASRAPSSSTSSSSW